MQRELDSTLSSAAAAAAAASPAVHRRGHLTAALPRALDAPEISVVVPVYDEVESAAELYRTTTVALSALGRT